jgi:lipoyl(octanoyl) transferase
MNFLDLGITDYADSLIKQKELHRSCVNGTSGDTVLITEHNPVVTLGRLSKHDAVIDAGYLDSRGIPVVRTDRGGQATYHSPGQLVMYPVMDMRRFSRDLGKYLDFLEKFTLDLLSDMKVAGRLVRGKRGVFVEDRKVASIGIGVKNWVSYHGLSVNICNDLEPFSLISVCGEKSAKVSSIEKESGVKVEMDDAKRRAARIFSSLIRSGK